MVLELGDADVTGSAGTGMHSRPAGGRSRGTEHGYPILNYVQHSSNILRKVRLGQPLDAAMHWKPPRSPNLKEIHLKISQNEERTDSLTSAGVNFRRERSLNRLRVLPGPHVQHSIHMSSSPVSRSGARKRNKLPPTVVPALPDRTKHLDGSSGQHAESDISETNSSGGLSNSDSPPAQHNAALIIARFFRSVCRLDNAADRARELLRRRWREQHPDKYRTPLFELTNHEQLRVLQLYNPHLYGSQHPVSPLASASKSTRLASVPQMEQHKRLRQWQILARMGQETALLNETSQQKTQTPLSKTTTLNEAYQRQSPASRERPRTVLGRERIQQTHDLVMFAKSPPSFRYYSTSQRSRGFRTMNTRDGAATLNPLSGPTSNWQP